MTIFVLGCVWGAQRPNVNFGASHISKTVRLESGNFKHVQIGQAHFPEMKI